MLLDLTAQPFTHGHAYVAVSRIYEPGAGAVYVDETCCVDGADGRRRGVIANVTYPRFLRPLREAARVARGPPRPPRGGGAALALALAEEAQLFLPMEGMARGAAARKKRRRVWDIGEVLEAGGWERAGRGRDGKNEGREGGSGEGG